MKTPLLLTAALVLLTSPAFAQTFKVLKVKGNKAIIQVPKGITLDQGSKYSIDAEGSADIPRLNENAESRQYVAGGSAEIFFGSTKQEADGGSSSSTSQTEIMADLKFGWNKQLMEYGPIAVLGINSTDSLKTTTIGVGGFYDYNFAPNVYGTHLLYGVGAKAMIGQESTETTFANTTTSASTTIIRIGGGPFAKWFVFGGSTCVRADARLDIQRGSGDGVTTTETGVRIAAGLESYF